MSHVSVMKMEIKDLDALEKACKEIGLELVRGQKTYKWYGRWVKDYHGDDAAYKNGIRPEDYGKCEHAIRVPGNKGAYEIGVARKDNGELTLVWDFYCGGFGMEQLAGKDGSLLRSEYALQFGAKTMMKKGFKVRREINPVTKRPRMIASRSV